MIPFPGESITCVDAWSAALGYDLGSRVAYRGVDRYSSPPQPTHQVITSGEEWWCWAYSGTDGYRSYLEAADDTLALDVSWVIEVLGGSGTLALSDFHDNSWSRVRTSPLPNTLGVLAVSGPGTYVVPTASFSNSAIRRAGYEGGPLEVHLKCVSGSIDVQQVKLRAWPTGGPRGYWSDQTYTQPGASITPSTWTQPVGFYDDGIAHTNSQEEWRTWAQSQYFIAGQYQVFSQNTFMQSGTMAAEFYHGTDEFDPDRRGGNGQWTVNYFQFNPFSVYTGPGAAGVDWVRPPTEVQGDEGRYIFSTTGPETLSWTQNHMTALHTITSGGTEEGGYRDAYGSWHVALEPVSDFAPVGPEDLAYQYIGRGSEIATIQSRGLTDTSSVEVDIVLPTVQPNQLYRIVQWHDGHVQQISEEMYSGINPGGGSNVLETYRGRFRSTGDPAFETLRAVWAPAPYRYWNPTATPPGPDPDPGTGSQTWDDWFVPGWGDWSWFPDYGTMYPGWDGTYPTYPTDLNDYYIPLPTLPTYHYLPFDLNTNTQLGEIPLEDVTYSHKLSAPGSANFSIPVTPEMLKQQIKQSSIPGKTGIYIVRDNQIVWGGIIWKRQYDSSNRQVRFEAGTFESYFDHRFQSNVLGFEDVDQMTIARTLALQAADEMHIDVDPAVSGVNRYYNAFYYDFKTIGGEIDSLASLWDGFDWNVRVYLDNTGTIRRRLVWGYPQLGVQAADTSLIFEYPGNIRSYTVDADADKAGNRLWAIGGGQGLDQIQFESRDDAQLAAGWPLLETTTSYKDVFQPARLQARSKQDLERMRPPVTLISVEVDPFSDPKVGTYNPGDWARFILEDNWNNPSIDIKRRIVGYTVNVSATSPLDRVTLDIDAGDTT